jgi:hypothetical protein
MDISLIFSYAPETSSLFCWCLSERDHSVIITGGESSWGLMRNDTISSTDQLTLRQFLEREKKFPVGSIVAWSSCQLGLILCWFEESSSSIMNCLEYLKARAGLCKKDLALS